MINFAETNLIYKCLVGSKAYGLDTDQSDTDIKGICIPPKNYFYGLDRFEQDDSESETTIFNIQKFVKLAMECNPNIIEMLFVDENDIIFINEWGQKLRDNRNLFLSKRARYTFAGYAFAQLKRIKGHRKWIVNPQTMPKKEDFFKEKIAVLENGDKKIYMKFLENEYDLAVKKFQQYETWKRERNEKRAELENKFGYDTKHASHLLRLLRMGCEILETGQVIVKRPDRLDLLDLKLNGNRTYDQLILEAEEYEKKLELLYETSKLPKIPNYKEINNLLITLIESYLNK